MGVDDVGVVLTKQRLGGGADAVAFLQFVRAAVRHPGALGGKALHMVLLLLQQALGDEHGQVYVLMPRLLELLVQEVLNVLPDGVAVGAVNEHALDAGIVDELRLFAHVGVPLGKVGLHVGDLFHLFFVLCHFYLNPFRRNPWSTILSTRTGKVKGNADRVRPALMAPFRAYSANTEVKSMVQSSRMFTFSLSPAMPKSAAA